MTICPATVAPAEAIPVNVYQAIGGRAAVTAAVDGFYQRLGRPSWRADWDGRSYSARSTLATDVRAARQPGTMAVRMARASVDVATAATVTIEMAGWGTT
jgi:hypothetical protein